MLHLYIFITSEFFKKLLNSIKIQQKLACVLLSCVQLQGAFPTLIPDQGLCPGSHSKTPIWPRIFFPWCPLCALHYTLAIHTRSANRQCHKPDQTVSQNSQYGIGRVQHFNV